MAKQKKKRAKHGGQAKQESGYMAHVCMGGFQNTGEVIEAFREMEEDSYTMGRADRSGRRGVMPMAEFAEDFSDLLLPPPMKAVIVKANYAVYMDGYHGRAFQSRTICEEV